MFIVGRHAVDRMYHLIYGTRRVYPVYKYESTSGFPVSYDWPRYKVLNTDHGINIHVTEANVQWQP
jgi:hypothetical protein